MQDIANNCKQSQLNKLLLSENWYLFKSAPAQYQSPSEINFSIQQPLYASVPGTVAVAVNLKEPDCWTPADNYDDFDWWYQKEFDLDKQSNQKNLIMEGLATIANVWLNDVLILSSDNMFHRHEIDIEKILKNKKNILTLCFKSLTKELNQRHPRPKWKTKLVANQSVRWFRTTLIGRIPGWTPPVSAVGPWKPIYLVDKSTPANININASVEENIGIVKFACQLLETSKDVVVNLKIGSSIYPLDTTLEANIIKMNGTITIPNVKLWWPHTHGLPNLYSAKLLLNVDGKEKEFDLADIGFKSVQLNQSDNNFKISVNHQSIFCRGACWTTNDIVSLTGSKEKLLQTLTLMRDAGANMIRIGGTMVYEQDAFYQICDQLGILVWQDFMFANMDYPFEDDIFLKSVETEIKQQLQRLSKHACVAIYCGNSEIQQQVAMLGFDRTVWEIPFYEKILPELCHIAHPTIPYVSSSPHGGDLPFRSNQGLSHYYGVGAYLRSVTETRLHNVKFTSECLGFSNIPVSKTRNSVLKGQLPATHNPIWKQRTPRDSGTGWDFEDVRDHYLKEIFDVEPVHLRSFDPDRYILLSEVVTGEIMSQVFSEWRSPQSGCNGGLVWFLSDFWPGAGWGIIDSLGQPKACYYYLKRAWQPVNILMTDESLSGVDLHICNNTQQELNVVLEVILLDQRSTKIASVDKPVKLSATESRTYNIENLLQQFHDVSYCYRFGSVKHQIISASLRCDEQLISESFIFPNKHNFPMDNEAELIIETNLSENGYLQLKLQCNKFLYAVNIECPGFIADNNYFHLMPKTVKIVTLKKTDHQLKRIKGYVNAVNLPKEISFKLK